MEKACPSMLASKLEFFIVEETLRSQLRLFCKKVADICQQPFCPKALNLNSDPENKKRTRGAFKVKMAGPPGFEPE